MSSSWFTPVNILQDFGEKSKKMTNCFMGLGHDSFSLKKNLTCEGYYLET